MIPNELIPIGAVTHVNDRFYVIAASVESRGRPTSVFVSVDVDGRRVRFDTSGQAFRAMEGEVAVWLPSCAAPAQLG